MEITDIKQLKVGMKLINNKGMCYTITAIGGHSIGLINPKSFQFRLFPFSYISKYFTIEEKPLDKAFKEIDLSLGGQKLPRLVNI